LSLTAIFEFFIKVIEHDICECVNSGTALIFSACCFPACLNSSERLSQY
jgi:hypothetical protein